MRILMCTIQLKLQYIEQPEVKVHKESKSYENILEMILS